MIIKFCYKNTVLPEKIGGDDSDGIDDDIDCDALEKNDEKFNERKTNSEKLA